MRKGSFRKYRVAWVLYFSLFGVLALTAQDPVFTARVSSSKMPQHTVFEIEFELKNASGAEFTPPSFKDFNVVGGPSVGSSTVIINGSMTRSQSWTYSLLANKQGVFTIGSATIMAGRKKWSTRPVTIEVTAPSQSTAQGSGGGRGQPVVLRAETNAKQYYPGQQIILTYRLLFNEDIQSINALDEDEYSDFFVQNFSDFSHEATFETINGVQYTSRIIKTMALFAHQSGKYTIRPMVMTAGINAPFPGNQGFFAMRRVQEVQVASEPLTIHILPLPSDAPSGFSGAVGQYKINTIPSQTDITTDDAFALELQIEGDGDPRRWDVPKPVTRDSIEMYDPRIIEDKSTDAGNIISNRRRIQYQMIPAAPGDYSIYIPFTYFDPTIRQFVTISSDTIHLHVTKGTGIKHDTLSGTASMLSQATLMNVTQPWLRDRFWTSWIHLLLFGLIVSGTGFGLWFRQKQRQEASLPLAERLRMTSASSARSRLETLQAGMESMDAGAFFGTATEVYHTFLMERFSIPASELDEAGITRHMTTAGVDPDVISRAIRLFVQSLSVRYGGIPGGYSRTEMLDECRQLISLLES